jgi:peptide/nickel transport system permease protein
VTLLSRRSPRDVFSRIPARGLAAGRAVLKRDKEFLVGVALASAIILIAISSPILVHYNPQTSGVGLPLQPPSDRYWMGTDRLGMDVYSRVISGARVDVLVAVAGAAAAAIIGTSLGLITGYWTNWASDLLVRLSDLFKAFPVFLLAMLIVVATGRNIANLIFVLAFCNAPVFLRLVHAQTTYVRRALYVEGARAVGNPHYRVLYRHILPNVLGPILAESSITMGHGMLLVASLSFIGAGVQAPTPEWGSMIAIGAVSIAEDGSWWPSVFPGLALTTTVVAFSMIGDALNRLTDPRRN